MEPQSEHKGENDFVASIEEKPPFVNLNTRTPSGDQKNFLATVKSINQKIQRLRKITPLFFLASFAGDFSWTCNFFLCFSHHVFYIRRCPRDPAGLILFEDTLRDRKISSYAPSRTPHHHPATFAPAGTPPKLPHHLATAPLSACRSVGRLSHAASTRRS